MAFVKVARHGKVTVVDREGKLYLVYTVNGEKQRLATGYPAGGKRIPPQVLGMVDSINKAFAAARATKTLKAFGVDPAANGPRTDAVAFDVALEEAISKSAGSEYHKKNLRGYIKHFTAYVKTISPEAKPYFHEIDVSHLIGFVQAKQPEVSNKSLRAYLSPILMASRYWTSRDPKRYHRIDFDMRVYLPLKKKEIKVWTLEQALKVKPLCEKTASVYAMPMLMLGAFAGLNINEIQRLQKKDWDGRRALLSIRQAKTEYRHRTLPLVGLVQDWCNKAFGELEGPESYLITTTGGGPMPIGDYKNMGRGFQKRVIDPAVAKYGEAYAIKPSDCRETFVNLMVAAKVDGDAQRAYAGHAAKDVHAGNYADYSKPQVLREHVILPLEAKFPKLRSQKGHSKRSARILSVG